MALNGSESMRTFGDRPKRFQIEEGGEYYYIGSEVSYCMNDNRVLRWRKTSFIDNKQWYDSCNNV